MISIIVPVYNAEKYIRQSLDSIRNQTYTDFEVILVDDGSTDGSGIICDEYAKADNRFHVIHQENGGVSVARQIGINSASGEYTIHIDPDDWVDETMLEELLRKAELAKADMVICDYWLENSSGTYYISQNPGEKPTAESVFRKILLLQLHGGCWNKLLKRESYQGIGFYPSSLSVMEDELFNLRLLSENIKVVYYPKAFYHYRTNNENSLTHSLSSKNIKSEIIIVSEVKRIMLNNKVHSEQLLYNMKKRVLFDLFCSKRFNKLKVTYPEIHYQIINECKNYNFHLPRISCLSLAMRGYPLFAFYFYKINMKVVSLVKLFQRGWTLLN